MVIMPLRGKKQQMHVLSLWGMSSLGQFLLMIRFQKVYWFKKVADLLVPVDSF